MESSTHCLFSKLVSPLDHWPKRNQLSQAEWLAPSRAPSFPCSPQAVHFPRASWRLSPLHTFHFLPVSVLPQPHHFPLTHSPVSTVTPLQFIFCTAAKVIFLKESSNHTLLFKTPQWILISFRIKSKSSAGHIQAGHWRHSAPIPAPVTGWTGCPSVESHTYFCISTFHTIQAASHTNPCQLCGSRTLGSRWQPLSPANSFYPQLS